MVDFSYAGESHSHDTVHFSNRSDYDKDEVAGISRVTWVGVAVNVFLGIVKSVFGIMSGSRALVADAMHTISDLATDCVILVGVRYWTAPADAEHPHGHQKIETLVTMIIGIALGVVAIGMGYEAVHNLTRAAIGLSLPESAEPGTLVSWLALAAALVSLISKELLYRWTAAKGVQLGSSAVVANAWHHRTDAFSSIPPALTIGGNMVASRFGYNLWYLDPVGTLVICVMLLQAAWEIMAPTLGALLDSSADRQMCSAIRKTILDTPGVDDTHRIRTRCIGSGAVAVDLHITVAGDLTVTQGHYIAADVKYRILKLAVPGVDSKAVDVMVHVEPSKPEPQQLPGRKSANTKLDWTAKKL